MTSMNNPDRDLEIEALLAAADPGRGDDTYWPRFHRSVMERAKSELTRRRAAAELTITQLVSSWGRTLIPTAAAAAAVGAFFLLRPATIENEVGVIAVEEELVQGIEGPTIPDVLENDDFADAGGAVFASEIF